MTGKFRVAAFDPVDLSLSYGYCCYVEEAEEGTCWAAAVAAELAADYLPELFNLLIFFPFRLRCYYWCPCEDEKDMVFECEPFWSESSLFPYTWLFFDIFISLKFILFNLSVKTLQN